MSRTMHLWRVIHLLYICYLIPAAGGNQGGLSSSTQDGGSGSPLGTVCTPGTCRNGQCYTVGQKAQCYCHGLFRGVRCEQVDLNHVTFTVIGNIVIFQWSRPPRLAGYSFVYYELDNRDGFMYKTDIMMGDNEDAALVANLKGGHTMYRICIEDEMLAEKVVTQDAVEYLTNCVNLSTQPDYHTLVAWCIAAMLAAVAVVFIYFQKDKLELLYFSKPVYLSYEPPSSDSVKYSQSSSWQTADILSSPTQDNCQAP